MALSYLLSSEQPFSAQRRFMASIGVMVLISVLRSLSIISFRPSLKVIWSSSSTGAKRLSGLPPSRSRAWSIVFARLITVSTPATATCRSFRPRSAIIFLRNIMSSRAFLPQYYNFDAGYNALLLRQLVIVGGEHGLRPVSFIHIIPARPQLSPSVICEVLCISIISRLFR